ncbi:MAG: 4-diphosphocytidyl-2C-methyl-D-erythritol kinase [Lysinibacillus sp.]|nr:4-diphosphocytidyl-2C-methyl-D-erythritol kinase [Lysinibacillus sp.]
MEEPLLFIQSPSFYYYDVEDEKDEAFLDESTSVYEISRRERIKNSVIAKQLHFFTQPINRKNRQLVFNMNNGEKIIGVIDSLDGINLKVQTTKETVVINANDIKSISLSKASL